MLAALAGMPVQASGGGVLPPRHENLAGITAPSVNEGLRTVIATGLADVAAGLADVAAGLEVGVCLLPGLLAPVPPQAASVSASAARTEAASS